MLLVLLLFLDENNSVVKLDDVGPNSMKQWSIEQVEANLLNFKRFRKFKSKYFAKIKEFTMSQLTTETEKITEQPLDD
jgi:hypothetical protein